MSATGTARGASSRNSGRSSIPSFTNTPASSIPRSVDTRSAVESDAGGSALSSSRQKQGKKDEACAPWLRLASTASTLANGV